MPCKVSVRVSVRVFEYQMAVALEQLEVRFGP